MEHVIETTIHDIDQRITFGKYKGRTLYTALVNEPEYIIAMNEARILKVNPSLIKVANNFIRGRLTEDMYLDILYHLNKNWDNDRRY